jgi:Coenzyme PQQ synthesis protein D (PqqD)
VSRRDISEYVVLSLKNGTYYGLDNVGAEVWRLVETPTTVGDICGKLVEMFEVDGDTCRRDVLRLVNELADNGLVEIDTP